MDDRELVDCRVIETRPPVCKTSVLPLSLAAHGALSWFRATLSCSSGRRFHQISLQGEVERPAGNDPASSRWQREALPLSYGRVVGRDRVELPQHRGGAFTAPWVRQYPAYPCWLRRTELNGLPLGHEPSELPVLHSASNRIGLVIAATARSPSAGRATIGGSQRSCPPMVAHPSRFERAPGSCQVDLP